MKLSRKALGIDNETEEKDKENSYKIEDRESKEIIESSVDPCETTPQSGETLPIPYPNSGKASDSSSGSKISKIEDEKIVEPKTDVEKRLGDEEGTSEGESGIGGLRRLLEGEVLGIPLWIWALLVIILLAIALAWSMNITHPIEPLE